MSKPHQKLLAFNKLYCEIQKMYGFKTANLAFEKMWNYSIYMHDFNTATFISYCFAYDIKDIVEKGLFFIDNYNAKPPKHLDSFVQILMEAICFLARRQSGAVGLPNLIPYLYYFWSRDVANGYYTKDPETYKRQQIQALIYRLNQPWVRSDQSAFTNVSVYDNTKHEVKLIDRNLIYLSGISKIISFDSEEFLMESVMGIILLKGQDLEIVKLALKNDITIFKGLSKELRADLGKRTLPIRSGDKVRVLRGDFKGHEGEVLSVDYNSYKVTVEEVTLSKPDGTATFLPVDPSNLVIIDANLKDDRRIKNRGDN